MIREGCRLSVSARPSRRNSGEKTSWSVPSRARAPVTKPTGTVDFTTISARSFDGRHVADDPLDGRGVEGVGLGVVVGRGRDDDDVRLGVRRGVVGEGDVEVAPARYSSSCSSWIGLVPRCSSVDPVGVDVDADDAVLLPEQGGHGESDVPQADDDDDGHGAHLGARGTSRGCPGVVGEPEPGVQPDRGRVVGLDVELDLARRRGRRGGRGRRA